MTDTAAPAAVMVAIVEDDRITRNGLGLIIAGPPGYGCTQTFGSVEGSLRGMVSLPSAKHLLLATGQPCPHRFPTHHLTPPRHAIKRKTKQ